jgi:hypothetical protein
VFNFLLKIPIELVDLFILCQYKFIVCKDCSNRTYQREVSYYSPFLGEGGQHGAPDRVLRTNAASSCVATILGPTNRYSNKTAP